MSDVEAVSLPAALDVGQNPLAPVTVEGQPSSSAGPPPKKASPAPANSRAASDGSDGPSQTVNSAADDDAHSSPKADSEAETIIQSGRESLSPEKKRKHIRHDPQHQPDGVEGPEAPSRKRPRIDGTAHEEKHRRYRPPSASERPGSPSSSIVKVEKVDDSQPGAEGQDVPADGVKAERPRSHRKRSFSDVADSKEPRRANSQAPTAAPLRDPLIGTNAQLSRPSFNTRSLSPSRPLHQRSASGSQPSRQKKAPTPLLTGFQRQGSEDRQSISSSASGSPLPSAHLRKLGSGEAASASPAKQMGPKKLRDKSGRTLLARACAERKYDQVVARHAERPEDLNVPDNAGNTPLQIASLNGEEAIVKFLLEAGCEINTKNIDKDTPLIDAIENGNVEVVKLLLDAGANPRTVNAEGDEPYELVPSFVDDDEYEEMRKVIAKAKAHSRLSRRSEEHVAPRGSKEPSSRRASGMSPRDSPLHTPRSPPQMGANSRRKTGRSEVTRNDLLWTKPTLENLREFAAKGDEAGVVSILNILQKADTASLIAAAKGGHHDVLSLLYAMGNADVDPNPVRGAGHKPGYNTPMLAAIGRGNTAVIQLILNQPGFNPTRRLFEDRTYFELSRARQGESWEEEYDILKDAYENHSGGEKGRKDALSSPRRARGKEKEARPARKASSSPVARLKKPSTSPTANRHRDPLSKDVDSTKHKKLDKEKHSSMGSRGKVASKDANEHAVANSDADVSRPESSKSKTGPSARRGSESSGITRTDEFRKRRLIAGRRPRDRRPSLFSSDSLSGREDKPRPDTGPDSVSSLKRIRTDTSPERSRSRGADLERLSPGSRKKKRRVLPEEKPASVPNGGSRKADEDFIDDNDPQSPENPGKAAALQSSPNDVVPMENGDVKAEPEETSPNTVTPTDEKRAEIEAEERQQAEARKAEEERAAEEKRLAAEAERARLAKEEAERAARVAQEKAEEEDRKRKEAEQRRAKQAEDERQKRLEQERARMAKIRRDQEEQEQRRRDALPSRLRVAANLVGSNDSRARSHTWLKNFLPMVTAVTRQLEPDCAADVADEKWVPNYLVAPLLATNDLQLSQYASWEKRKATSTQRMNLWRVTRRILIQADEPDFRGSSVGQIMQKDCDTRPRYFDMEHVFWIRLSDFMDIVPHVPHLNGLELRFLSMHIDREPSASGFDPLQPNGHAFSLNGAPGRPAGFLNGYGPPRPSTYV